MLRVTDSPIVNFDYLQIGQFLLQKSIRTWSTGDYDVVFGAQYLNQRYRACRVSKPPVERGYKNFFVGYVADNLHFPGYFTTDATSYLASFLRPSSPSSSTRKRIFTTMPPHFSMSLAAASIVPPVAIRSSTSTTF